MNQNDLPNAVSHFEKAYVFGLKNYALLHNLGSVYYRLGNHENALKYLNLAIHDYPDEAESYNDRGQIHLIHEDFSLAKQDFEKAIELKNNWDTPFSNMGLMYKKQKKYTLAEQFFKEALKIDHNDINSSLNLASLYVETSKKTEALQVLDDLAQHHPNVVDIYLFRATIYASDQNNKLACEDLKKAKSMGAQVSSVDILNMCAE